MVDRLGRVEFFATLPPGLFVVLAIVLAFEALLGDVPATQSAWASLEPLARTVEEQPSLIPILLFLTYLAGSLIRALPVSWAEAIAGVRRSRPRFPFPAKVDAFLGGVRDYHAGTTAWPRLTLTEGKLPIDVFNFWKNYLCCTDPAAFQVYEAYEARSRMYAGMLFAGLLAFAAGAAVLGVAFASAHAPSRVGMEMFVVSGAVAALFGSQLYGVRETEALVLVSLYAVTRQRADPTAL